MLLFDGHDRYNDLYNDNLFNGALVKEGCTVDRQTFLTISGDGQTALATVIVAKVLKVSGEIDMIEVREMELEDTKQMLARVGYGHLACARDHVPYVVPIHYAYRDPIIYIYTTEGKKTEIIDGNPKVCLQVEEVVDKDDWRSIVVNGDARRVTDLGEREEAVNMIRSKNPSLTPAISIKWVDMWIRENVEVIYRIEPDSITGRMTDKVMINAVGRVPGA